MRKKIIRGTVMIFIVVAVAAVFSGFTSDNLTEEEYLLYELMHERTAIMQRAIFRVYDSEDGVADIEEIYDAFHELAEIETYPLLSDDCSAISSSAGSDFDKVINLKILDVRMISQTGENVFYETDVKWYMSGRQGVYDMTCSYKIMTSEDRGVTKLAYMEVIS